MRTKKSAAAPVAAATTPAQRKAVLPVVAAAFKSAAQLKGRAPERQFEHMARAMDGLAVRIAGDAGEAHAEFATQAATALHGLAHSWRRLAKKPAGDSCHVAAAAADQLDALSDALLHAAQSIHAPRGAPPAAGAEVAALLHVSGEVIFALALSAERLREAAGVSAPFGSAVVALPAASHCGCAAAPSSTFVDARANMPVAAEPSWFGPALPRPGLEAEALACELDAMPFLIASLAHLFERKSRFFLHVLAYFDEYWYVACDDDCTFPGRPVPTLVGCVALIAGGGAWQPQIQVQWDFCCRNWCLVVWWETFIRSTTVTVSVGGVVNTKAQAIAAARQRAAAAIARLAAPASPC